MDKQNLHCIMMDGTVRDIPVKKTGKKVMIEKDTLPGNIDYFDFMPDYFTAETGDDGFMLVPNVTVPHSGHSSLTFYHPRKDGEEIFTENSMPVYACVRNGSGEMAVVTGMQFEYSLVLGVKNGKYYIFPRFHLNGKKPYEDIVIEFMEFTGKDARYQNMARAYRKFQLERGACHTLREKAEARPALKKYCDTIECRIRLAWKPVPSPVDEQVIGENEPEVHAELTFKDVGKIIEEFYRQGIDKVHFCLVGWNAGGHDGRFPDLFPVEPKCGTEDDLKELIAKANALGYAVSAHTNLIEGYSVAKRFDHDDVLQKNGADLRGGKWGGGWAYALCPKMAYEHYISQDMEDLKRLGFSGEHYLDVFSILKPFGCDTPAHPLTRREDAEYRCKILKKAQEAMGCSGSEGGWDFACDAVDYVLYAAFHFKEDREHPMCDEYVPFWNMVYHGIQVYNCFAASVNANLKQNRLLKVMNYAWGGRPLSYVNSRFIQGHNPWGDEDLRYHPEDQFRKDIAQIKQDYDFYRTFRHLQYEFFDDYDVLKNGLLKSTYSDGTVMLSNPTDHELETDGKKVAPFSCMIV